MNLEIQIQFESDPYNIEIIDIETVRELEKIINQIIKNSDDVINVKITDMTEKELEKELESEELINITDVENWLGQDYEYRALSTLVDLLNGSYPLEKFREDIKNYKEEK